MRIKSKVKSDQKGLERLIKRLKTLDSYEGEAGYYPEQRHPKHGVPLSHIAVRNEFGVPEEGIPSRPFMSDASSEGSIGVSRVATREATEVIHKKKNSLKALKIVAEEQGEWITQQIVHNNYLPNSKMTTAIKGKNDPLVDSGYLAENWKSKVKKKTTGDE